MYYSAFGLLAFLILIIENRDILHKRDGAFEKPAWRVYRKFLFAVLAYFLVDALWGVLESLKLEHLLFADTILYFILISVGILFWGQFTVVYLEDESAFGHALVMAGRLVAGVITLLTVVNIFVPILFTVDADCVYHALPARYGMLVGQILLLLLISLYAFSLMTRLPEKKRDRCRALGSFGLIMAFFLFIQLWFPYYPLYTVAYLLGTCLLHTFVVNDEKEEYKCGMEEAAEVAELEQTITSLLNNMPGMTFTKDAETGAYLACNRAFAEYAHKSAPDAVLGLTDGELFDAKTAGRFAEDDRMAVSMDKPYIFFEDVRDAVGNQRQFQITKLKYTDAGGRLCILGVYQDMTDMVRIQRENATTREAYEKARSTGIIYNHISQALARGYTYLFYVNLDSEEFIEYRPDEAGGSLTEKRRGWHFFEECADVAEKYVHPDDREAFLNAMDRKTLAAALDRDKVFVMTCRFVSKDGTFYFSVRISRMADDERYIIIGVSDVDELMKHRRAAERVREEQLAYTRLKALNGNYIWVYVVDPETNSYRELSEAEEAKSPTLAKEGGDFFAAMREASQKYTCPEDQKRFLTFFTKENVLGDIECKGVYTLHYRFILEGLPTYVILKAAEVEEKDGKRLVVGLINVDDQTRLEEKNEKRMAQAQARATVDALTGIKNKHAYQEAEQRLNEQIAEGAATEFAVVLLDLNDLKRINDTEGHSAGDEYIRSACKIICDTFKHSPVFRIGGDEFAVISRGDDYARIDELVEKMNARNHDALQNGGIVIACGMARYDNDGSVAPVFERADQRMYENKSELKKKKTGA